MDKGEKEMDALVELLGDLEDSLEEPLSDAQNTSEDNEGSTERPAKRQKFDKETFEPYRFIHTLQQRLLRSGLPQDIIESIPVPGESSQSPSKKSVASPAGSPSA
jgi:hypothetical protein